MFYFYFTVVGSNRWKTLKEKETGKTGEAREVSSRQTLTAREAKRGDKSFDGVRFVCHSCYPVHLQSPPAGRV